MLLLMDIGNTNIVIGISENNRIIKTYRLKTLGNLTEDEYYINIRNLLALDSFENKINNVIIASVVPQLDHIMEIMFSKYYNIVPIFVAPKIKSGLSIKIENPKQLGADLLAAAVGAFDKYGGPTIIVDLGTATKLTVITEKKEFIGGAICPGINGSLTGLVNHTAKLSSIPLAIPKKVISNDTISCMQSGLLYGHAAMIDGLILMMKKELNSECHVVITGGLSGLISPVITCPHFLEPNIVLEGLQIIFSKNI